MSGLQGYVVMQKIGTSPSCWHPERPEVQATSAREGIITDQSMVQMVEQVPPNLQPMDLGCNLHEFSQTRMGVPGLLPGLFVVEKSP